MAETAKKAAAKKAPAKKSTRTATKVKLGDRVFIETDPRHNNGATEAVADVVQVLDVKGESRVNLRVLLNDGEMQLRNVLVTTRARAKKAGEDGQRVAFTTPS